jgi:methionyl-tRNA formyltransferase
MLWTSAVDGTGAGGMAGEVLGWDADGVRVATADGVILLRSMSDAGDAPGPAAAWAERNGLRPGEVFEPVRRETAAWVLGLGPRPTESAAR